MKRPSNQDIERHYFEQFRAVYQLPPGEVEYTDKPDVILRGSDVLGIEIEQLYIALGGDPASEQMQRPRRERALALAQEIYLSAGGKHFELSVDFNQSHPIADEMVLARRLANLAKQIEGQGKGRVSAQMLQDLPELRLVWFNPKEYPNAAWRLTQIHGVPQLVVERVLEAVRGKSEKAKSYQPCNRYWLLLVVDFMNAAQDQSLDWPADQRVGTAAFERVLLYRPQFSEVVEVTRSSQVTHQKGPA